jgi:hypothetical protein
MSNVEFETEKVVWVIGDTKSGKFLDIETGGKAPLVPIDARRRPTPPSQLSPPRKINC